MAQPGADARSAAEATARTLLSWLAGRCGRRDRPTPKFTSGSVLFPYW